MQNVDGRVGKGKRHWQEQDHCQSPLVDVEAKESLYHGTVLWFLCTTTSGTVEDR